MKFRRAHDLGDINPTGLYQLSTQPWTFSGMQSGKAVRVPLRVFHLVSLLLNTKHYRRVKATFLAHMYQPSSSTAMGCATLWWIQPSVYKQHSETANGEECTNKLCSL